MNVGDKYKIASSNHIVTIVQLGRVSVEVEKDDKSRLWLFQAELRPIAAFNVNDIAQVIDPTHEYFSHLYFVEEVDGRTIDLKESVNGKYMVSMTQDKLYNHGPSRVIVGLKLKD